MKSLVPDEFVRLPSPWNMTNDDQRMDAILALSSDSKVVDFGLNVFALCLEYRARTYPFPRFEEHGVFNEYYIETRGFVSSDFTEWMPTFADVTVENILAWLRENPHIPPFIFHPVVPDLTLELAEEISKDWVPSLLRSYGDALYRWLDDLMGDPKHTMARDAYLHIIRDYLPKVDPRMSNKLVGAVWSLDEHRYDYLRAIVNDESILPEIRESARHYLKSENMQYKTY